MCAQFNHIERGVVDAGGEKGRDGTMKFLWPELLWLWVLLPALAAARVWLLRRRRTQLAAAWPGMFDAAAAAPTTATRSRLARHVGVLLLFAGLAMLIMAMARPVWSLPETGPEQTIVLAIDLSGSMAATDIAPNRLAAAQRAAKSFVRDLPRGVQVAVVAYADSAELVQPPTLVRERATDAIDRFQLQGGTAIGDGILTSLHALFPGQSLDLSEVQQPPPANVPPPTAAPGSYAEGMIVLLTDGENTMGNDPLDAARLAARRGVKVCTVGFGTAHGAIVRSEGASEHVGLDETGLQEIARLTRGEYFRASNGDELKQVYTELKGRLVTRMRETEATAAAVGLGAALLLAAAGLSLWRTGAVA